MAAIAAEKRYIRDGAGNACTSVNLRSCVDLLMIAPESVKASVCLPLCCSWYTQAVSWTPTGPAGVGSESLHCSITNLKLQLGSQHFLFTSSFHFDGSDLISFTVFLICK